MSDFVKDLFNKCEDMVDGRRVFDRTFQDIREYVRLNTTDFNGGPGAGQVRSGRVFDSTAVHANVELASGLCSHMVNASDRWFTLAIVGMEQHEIDEEGLAWLEIVSDIIYSCFGAEISGFNTTMHECMLDIGGFGMSCPYQYFDEDIRHLSFRSMSMSGVYFAENHGGRIDTTMVKRTWKVRQAQQAFKSLPDKLSKKKDTDEVAISHLVCPRVDRDIRSRHKLNKALASFWLCDDTKEIIEEGGYDQSPYHGARWMKLADEVYGCGPAKDCLPDILLLNKMERTFVKAAEKRVDPPLQVPDEGFALPLKTAPGSIIMVDGSQEARIEPLEFKGDIQWTLELANEKRDSIRKGFYSDWLRMEKENKEMTAFEVSDRRNEKLSLLAPMIGRIQGEQLNPLLSRSYQLLKARGYFPPAPPSLQRRKLEVKYLSPAARAQLAVKANEIGRYLSEVIPLIQVYPAIVDAIDFDKLAKKLAEYRSMTRSVLRTDAQIATVRAERQQQEQMQQMAEIAEPASKALKNVADAQSKGLNLGGMLG